MARPSVLALAAASVVALALGGCEEEAEPPAPPVSAGEVTFVLNGEPWSDRDDVTAWATASGGLALTAQADCLSDPRCTTFALELPNLAAGSFSVVYRDTASQVEGAVITESVVGDSAGAWTFFYPAREGSVTVEQASGPGEVASGTFAGVFVTREDQRAEPGRTLPDTLRITDGRFRVRLRGADGPPLRSD